jgi:hypothetical protein
MTSYEGDLKGTVKVPHQEAEIAVHSAVEFVAKDGKSVVHRL